MVNVNTIQAGTVFAWFMLIVILRRIVMLVVAGVARRGKPFPPGSRPPEDNKLRGGNVEVTTGAPDQIEFTKDVRVNKTIATAVFSDIASDPSTKTIVYGIIYLFVRIVYAMAYIMALQPWRSVMFGFGLAVTLACSLDLVITMSLRPN